MSAAPEVLGGRRVVAAALVGCLTLAPAAANAAPPWIKRAFVGRGGEPNRATAAPPVARYLIDDGGVFILDRTAPRPLLKFDDSPEVWVLSAARGPRGDMIYSNDMGEPLLRTTRLGGATVFTTRRPEGSAAAMAGASSPLRLISLGPVGLYQRLLQASVRSSRAAGRLIGFNAPNADPASDGLIADTAVIASEAVVTLASRAGGKALLSRVAEIDIAQGPQPGAYLRAGVVNITVAPAQGLAGRPSSVKILQAVGTR